MGDNLLLRCGEVVRLEITYENCNVGKKGIAMTAGLTMLCDSVDLDLYLTRADA